MKKIRDGVDEINASIKIISKNIVGKDIRESNLPFFVDKEGVFKLMVYDEL